MSGLRQTLVVALSMGAFVAGAAAVEKEPGDLWETTVQMSMEGMESMAMPPTTNRACVSREKGWTEPPGAMQDDSCEVVDWKMTGSKATWSMRCKDGTTGTGEMTFEGGQSYRGTVTLRSSEGNMAMKMSGRRVGDCDAGASRRQMEATQRQAEAAQQQAAQMQADALADACKQAAERFAVEMFLPPQGMCTSAEDAAALCANFRSEKGFNEVAGRPPYENPALPKIATLCGTETEAVRQQLCTAAQAKRSYNFLGRHCPAETKSVAEAECAGRKFTSIPDADLRGFCVSYATQSMSAENQPAEEEKKKESKSKKFLKGLVGR
jgi:hypothetical protein